jgi:hypothetical protein
MEKKLQAEPVVKDWLLRKNRTCNGKRSAGFCSGLVVRMKFFSRGGVEASAHIVYAQAWKT